ncbi:hypothetical protein BH10PSE9_BH10PSE9_18280 [soil metagenome]
MLDRQARSPGMGPSFEQSPPVQGVEIGLPQLLAFLRRQQWVIALSVATGLVLGAAYLAVTPPTYTASSTVLIDPRKVALFGSGNVMEDASITNSGVETQVQVLQSGRIARAVVDKLKLADDPDFMASRPSPFALVKGWASGLKKLVLGPGVSGGATEAAVDPGVMASGVLLGHMVATRVGLSYVINVTYTDDDPAQAARLANAITEAYLDDQLKTQVTTAQRASEWLQQRLADLQSRSNDNALSAQEKSAIRATYDSFLERYTQMVQQQSMPFGDAQMLTAATAPSRPTSPNTLIVLLGGLVLGGAVGFGIALVRELLDRTIRTRQQVEAAAGAPFLGFLPTFDIHGRSMRRIAKRSKRLMDANGLRFAAGPAYSVALTAPFSRYAETLRTAKVAAEGGPNGPVVVLGVVSALPNEGRSTVAINLARLIAQSGGRPLLIDGDMRNPTLSRDLVPPDSPGLAQVVAGSARISDVIWTDQSPNLQFIAAGTGGADVKDVNGILGAQATRAVINACRQQYDVVIVDLPATLPVVDVRAAAHLFDGFLLVAEWGYVTEDILARGIQAGGIEDRLIGVVLNKVNVRQLRRFDSANQAAVPSGNYLRSYSHIG